MPNDLWCKSDPIVKLSNGNHHTRLRILAMVDDIDATGLSVPDDKIIMSLTLPTGVHGKVLKEQDDPRLPIAFAFEHDIRMPGDANGKQVTCRLYVETPSELDDVDVRILVEDYYHTVLAVAIMGPGGEDSDGELALTFVATLRNETTSEEVSSDVVARATTTWVRPATSTWP